MPVLRRIVTFAAALSVLAASASARADDGPRDDLGEDDAGGWRASTGLRLEQWATPRGDSIGIDFRLALPEMSRGSIGVETFTWERVDVTQDHGTSDEGTVYQLGGVRKHFGGELAGVFLGAHVMSWSGGARGFTPWLGLRVGREGGLSLTADARMLGLGVIGRHTERPLENADLTVRLNGPRIRWARIAGRGRLRDVTHDDLRQRDASGSLGVEVHRKGRPIFVGLGVQQLLIDERGRTPDDRIMILLPEDMQPATPGRPRATIMLHVEVDMEMPRSLTD